MMKLPESCYSPGSIKAHKGNKGNKGIVLRAEEAAMPWGGAGSDHLPALHLLYELSPPTPLGETDKLVLQAQEPRWFGTSKP